MQVYLAIQSVLLVLLAVFVVGLLRSHLDILRALSGFGAQLSGTDPGGATLRAAPPPADDAAPGGLHDLVGTTPQGDQVSVELAGTAQLTLLAFLSTGCLTCREFWDAFAQPRNAEVIGRHSQVVLLTKGPDVESPGSVAELAPEHLRVVMSSDSFERYGVPYAPWFVVVDGDSSTVLGSGAASSFDELRQLLSGVLAEHGFRPGGQRSRREVLRELREAAAAPDEDRG